MTHRQRIITALSHEEPDRVPIDLGGSLASTIVAQAYPALRAELGLPVHDAEEALRYAGLAEIDEDVRTALDVDVIHAPRAFGTGKHIKTISDDAFIDEWGVRWRKPQQGHYYVEHAPFQDNATPKAVEQHDWPTVDQLVDTTGLADAIRKIRNETDYAISLEVRGRAMSMGQFLRGFEAWMMDLAANEAFVEALLERTTELQIASNKRLLEAVGDLVDIVYTCDDLGCQAGTLMSPTCFRRLLRPHFSRIWQHVRSNTQAKLMHHCCGSIRAFIGDFIELGVQILNPIQVSAAEMDPAQLKAQFGENLCFWGGVDTRDVMPTGTVDDVEAEVAKRIEQMARGGGYVLAAVHNLQSEVPPANIVAMYRAARRMGSYK